MSHSAGDPRKGLLIISMDLVPVFLNFHVQREDSILYDWEKTHRSRFSGLIEGESKEQNVLSENLKQLDNIIKSRIPGLTYSQSARITNLTKFYTCYVIFISEIEYLV